MPATATEPILTATGIGKRFGGVVALDHVSIDVYPGQITGLVGDNGAGKSTLIKILSSVLKPDSGEVRFQGAPVSFDSAASARAAGIETVYQDLALAGNMPVWANIYLGRETTRRFGLLDKRAMSDSARQMLERFRMNVPPMNAPVAALSGGQRQAVAIARAAAWGSQVIILDEPTAALGVVETRAVEEVILDLKQKGYGILLISHNLDQVFRLADEIWVLRRGRLIGHRSRVDTTPDEIVGMITGVELTTTNQTASTA